MPLLAFGASPAANEMAQEILGRALGMTPIAADLQQLTDDIGGRPTGSAALDAAVDWGVERFRAAGLESVHREPYVAAILWLPGTEMGEVTQPQKRALRVAALPFSSGTGPDGLEADVLSVGHGDDADFALVREQLRGKWALVITEPAHKIEDSDAEYLMTPRIFAAARQAGAIGVLWTSTHPERLLYRHPVGFDDTIEPLPGAMLEREEALRIGRLLARGRRARVRVTTVPRILRGIQVANVTGEIRGQGKPNEFVVLGAHLDSWDLGQGALDNGCNAALVVDAARQIAVVARTRRPTRTIRFVLYTAEEDGFLGSRADSRLHSGELDRTVAMITFDAGAGRTTGFSTGGRIDLVAAADAALLPAGILGPFTQTTDAFVGTDNYDYLVEGVPTFVANQDVDAYLPRYHAATDTYDKVDLRELKMNTAIAAVFTWQLANAPTAPGPRQSHAEVLSLSSVTGLEKQMRTFRLWDDFVSGSRGRAQ